MKKHEKRRTHNPCNADVSSNTPRIVLSDELGRQIISITFDDRHVMPLIVSLEPILAGEGYVKPHCDYLLLCAVCSR